MGTEPGGPGVGPGSGPGPAPVRLGGLGRRRRACTPLSAGTPAIRAGRAVDLRDRGNSTRVSAIGRCGRSTTTPSGRLNSSRRGGHRTWRSTSASRPSRPSWPSPAPRCGCTTTSCNSSRDCCVGCAPIFTSGSSCTPPSRPRSSSCSFPVGARSWKGFSARTLSASRFRWRLGNSPPWPGGSPKPRDEGPTSLTKGEGFGSAPIPFRSTSTTSRRSPVASRRSSEPRKSESSWAIRPGSCWVSTAWTTRKGSSHVCRRTGRCWLRASSRSLNVSWSRSLSRHVTTYPSTSTNVCTSSAWWVSSTGISGKWARRRFTISTRAWRSRSSWPSTAPPTSSS